MCFEEVIISFKNAWEIWIILRRGVFTSENNVVCTVKVHLGLRSPPVLSANVNALGHKMDVEVVEALSLVNSDGVYLSSCPSGH